MRGNVSSSFAGIISLNPQNILKVRQPQPLNEAVLNSKQMFHKVKLQILMILHLHVYTVTKTKYHFHAWFEFHL